MLVMSQIQPSCNFIQAKRVATYTRSQSGTKPVPFSTATETPLHQNWYGTARAGGDHAKDV